MFIFKLGMYKGTKIEEYCQGVVADFFCVGAIGWVYVYGIIR